VVGFWLCLPIAVLAITGAYFAFPDAFKRVATIGGGTLGALPPSLDETGPAQVAASLDELVASARAAMPSCLASVVQMPASPRAVVSVSMKCEGEPRPTGNSVVYLHPKTGVVLAAQPFASQPYAARLLATLGPLHFGDVGGPVVWWLWLIAGAAPGTLFLTGFLVWFRRVTYRRASAAAA
jgi:uncharacterized iron-regulated membrane protein